MIIPPPEQRLCLKIGKDGKPHNRPICPGMWRTRHRTTGCAKCVREQNQSPQARKKRAERWSLQFISCINHPGRRCQKSLYVHNRRKCRSCFSKKADGTRRPSYRRSHWKTPSHRRAVQRQSYRKSMERRRHGRGRMRAIRLFERSTGMSITDVNKAWPDSGRHPK
jgi:hypothetical protein